MSDLFSQPTQDCRSCGAPIFFGTTVKNKKVPLDAKPLKRVVLDDDGTARVVDTYTTHFETCPNAKDWRKKE